MTGSSRNPTEQTRGGVWDAPEAVLLCGEESKLTHHNHSITKGLLSFSTCFPDTAGNTSPSLLGQQKGKPWSNTLSRKQGWSQRLLKKRLLEKNAGSDLRVNFSQGLLLKEVFFPAKNSDFFLAPALLSCFSRTQQKTFHFLSCLVGCWGDVISELVYVSAGPHSQQNLWHMPVPPVADWIRPGKWRKPQLAELQKMNFT